MARRVTVAEYLTHAIEMSGKSQRVIAEEVGYSKANLISMMKKGMTKVPINKVPALAKATGVDQRAFLRVVLQEYHPELLETLHNVFGAHVLLSDVERKMIDDHRKLEAQKIEDASAQ